MSPSRITSAAILFLLSFVTCADLHAIPARPVVLTDTLADGSTVSYRLMGDESSHRFVSTDGRTLVVDSVSGKLRYATSGEEAATSTPRHARRRMPSRAPESMLLTDYPSTGSPRSLVIVAEYSDVKLSIAEPMDYFNGLLNTKGFDLDGATGSVRDYFEASSDGQFTPIFDVYGIVTLPKSQKYYGENGPGGGDLRAHEMIIDACDILASQGVDFSVYDCNNDGFIDNVYVFYAGRGEATGMAKDVNTVWPHSWDIFSAGAGKHVYNGKILNHYACSNEISYDDGIEGLGAFCHEFSHVLGLPDLYPTASAGPISPDQWSVLDTGGYLNDGRTPPLYSSFERMSMGWMKPQIITLAGIYTLNPLDSSNHAYMIETDNDNEFFLFENRRKRGWDSYLQGNGMLVWHIDYDKNVWYENKVNNQRSHQRVDVVEAVGRSAANPYSKPSDLFPGTGGITEFTATSIPAFLSWSRKDPGLPLTEIREEGDLIVFRAGSGCDSGIDDITAAPGIVISGGTAVTISGTDLPARIYDLSGREVYSGTERTIPLAPGIYIVTVGGKTGKVVLV